MDSLLARFVALWTRARLDPADAGARLRDGKAPVCYVLERYSAVDFAVLHSLCKGAKLPRPRRRLLPDKAAIGARAFRARAPGGLLAHATGSAHAPRAHGTDRYAARQS